MIEKETKKLIVLEQAEIHKIRVRLTSLSPLLQNKPDPNDFIKKKNKPIQKRELTDEERFQKAIHVDNEGRYVHPISALIGAMKTLVNIFDCGFTPKEVTCGIRFDDEWIHLETSGPVMDIDWGRNWNSRGTGIKVVRPKYESWWAVITIGFLADIFNESQVLNILNLAGNFVGIGSYRQERGGTHGRFCVETKE